MRLSSLVLSAFILATPSLVFADEDGSALVTPDHGARQMRSPALLGGGIALAALGTIAAPIGAIILIVPKEQPMCMGCSIDYTSSYVAGALFLGAGLSAIAASIPMMVIGAKRVPISIGSGPRGSAGLTLQATF